MKTSALHHELLIEGLRARIAQREQETATLKILLRDSMTAPTRKAATRTTKKKKIKMPKWSPERKRKFMESVRQRQERKTVGGGSRDGRE